MAAERFWVSINGGEHWMETTKELFRRLERSAGFLPTAAFSSGQLHGTTFDPAKQGKKVLGIKPLSNKWMCPQCGDQGVDVFGTPGCVAPLCHRKGCDYLVSLVNISDILYNRLRHQERQGHQ